jgi:hypothetical protein
LLRIANNTVSSFVSWLLSMNYPANHLCGSTAWATGSSDGGRGNSHSSKDTFPPDSFNPIEERSTLMSNVSRLHVGWYVHQITRVEFFFIKSSGEGRTRTQPEHSALSTFHVWPILISSQGKYLPEAGLGESHGIHRGGIYHRLGVDSPPTCSLPLLSSLAPLLLLLIRSLFWYFPSTTQQRNSLPHHHHHHHHHHRLFIQRFSPTDTGKASKRYARKTWEKDIGGKDEKDGGAGCCFPP